MIQSLPPPCQPDLIRQGLHEAFAGGGRMDDSPMKPRESLGLATPYAAPESDMQAALCGVYAQFLRVAPVGIDDDFFDLGGDSFSALQISLAIEADMGLQIESGDIAKLASVRAVSQR